MGFNKSICDRETQNHRPQPTRTHYKGGEALPSNVMGKNKTKAAAGTPDGAAKTPGNEEETPGNEEETQGNTPASGGSHVVRRRSGRVDAVGSPLLSGLKFKTQRRRDRTGLSHSYSLLEISLSLYIYIYIYIYVYIYICMFI